MIKKAVHLDLDLLSSIGDEQSLRLLIDIQNQLHTHLAVTEGLFNYKFLIRSQIKAQAIKW